VVAIPDYQSLMRPVLETLADGRVRAMRDLTEEISNRLALSDEDRRQTITSGMSLIANRVHWSVTYLFKARAVDRPQRGRVQITDRGRELLATAGEIRNSTLEQFAEYREFYDKHRRKKAARASSVEPMTPPDEDESPDDLIARADAGARVVLASELLEKVRSIEATAFERLVLKLLEAMGYGGLGLMRHTGRTGDGGVDGVIEEDKLGLNRIDVQAKRYGAGNTVGSEEMRNFLGAMSGKVDRGVFLTTSTFTPAAERELDGRGVRVVLINGEELVDLMIDHGVGVEPVKVATINRINEDFFEEL
jgi:restriction system protein